MADDIRSSLATWCSSGFKTQKCSFYWTVEIDKCGDNVRFYTKYVKSWDIS